VVRRTDENSDDDVIITCVLNDPALNDHVTSCKTESDECISHDQIDFKTRRISGDVDSEGDSVCDINFQKPSADHLVRCILGQYPRYEVSSPIKRCRENKVYTVSNVSLNDVTADDNGAYITNTGDTPCVVERDENGRIILVQCLKKDKCQRLYYKQRIAGNEWKDVEPQPEKMYTLHRYYRESKSFKGLRMIVATLKGHAGTDVHPRVCVVYSFVEDSGDKVLDSEPSLPHGNMKRKEHLQQPYYRTSSSVLKRIDNLLETSVAPSSVLDTVMDESGGPMQSTSVSSEPRNLTQVINRKTLLKKPLVGVPKTDLDKLRELQRDQDSLVRTVLQYGDCYIAFVYSDKQMKDIEMFCCKDTKCAVFGIDTTFKLCNMWVTDTSYRNLRLLSTRTGKHPVFLGPAMLHFTKDETTFRRFCAELICANPSLSNIRKIGVDMEAAIFNGFNSLLKPLLKLFCVRHLRKRDDKAIDNLQEKSQLSTEEKKRRAEEIVRDLYGTQIGAVYEYGLAEAEDEDELTAKVESLKPRWDKLCPGFYEWFISHRKKVFVESVIKSARIGMQVDGLYYNNDVESLHAKEKREQAFKTLDVIGAVKTLQTVIERETNLEKVALYGNTCYVLAPEYKIWFAPAWHTWNKDRCELHWKRYQNYVPPLDASFQKPANAGRKPGSDVRKRSKETPSIAVDRIQLSAATSQPLAPSVSSSTVLSFPDPRLTPSASSTCGSGSAASAMSGSTSSTSASAFPASSLSASSLSASLSFPDPRLRSVKPFELHLRRLLHAKISKCYGNCGRAITPTTVLLVKSFGTSTFYDSTKKCDRTTKGNQYIHMEADCLKTYDTDEYYLPNEDFKWNKITLDPRSKQQMPAHEIEFLAMVGIRVNTDAS
jgi:hypothetical protein